MSEHFVSIRFRNFKAFRTFYIALGPFNILVGPNNAGKSTVIGAFRILAEGLRRGRARNPEYSNAAAIRNYCYPVNLRDLPVSTENVFCDYDDSEPALIEFAISNGNKLRLVFPERDSCYLVCETLGRPVRSTTDFKREFDVSVSFVPVLGPVEHDEELNQEETARRALLTHRASRNFRNIWHHFPEGFSEFSEAIRQSWPGMEIGRPELTVADKQRTLHMFCPEDRIPRELYWAGFGFQVWCQMLTFISKAEPGSILIIDEPDIYLHSDLQRQLVGILRARDGDVLIATHSTEILSEAELGEIVVLNKNWKQARRIQQAGQLKALFSELGSRLNPVITQLAKTRRALFVEGGDFTVLSAFARKLGKPDVANGGKFAVVPTGGFSPARVRDYSHGMEQTLGSTIKKFVIFDRDYRSERRIGEFVSDLRTQGVEAWVHGRKEIENFLLVPSSLNRAVENRIRDRQARGGKFVAAPVEIYARLTRLTDSMKSEVFGQFNGERLNEERQASSGMHAATTSSKVHSEFEAAWQDLESRLKLVPGKELLSKLNDELQGEYGIAITPKGIIEAMMKEEVPSEMVQLVDKLSLFCQAEAS